MSATRLPRMDTSESRAWLALISTAELLPAALDAQLQREQGMTHYEFIVLSTLQRHRTLRMGELASGTNATLPRASKVISRMQRRGLVERVTASGDRRGVEISLTKEGRRALVRATPGHFDTVRALVLDRLSPAQLDALADALDPILDALDPEGRFYAGRGVE